MITISKKTAIKASVAALASMIVSVAAALIIVPILGGHPDGPGFWMSVFCPLAIAWPASAYQFSQSERLQTLSDRLAIAHRELDDMHCELVQAHAVLQEKSRRDGMTGALNRETFFASLEAASGNRRSSAVLLIDADHFKRLNDTYGHSFGDHALKAIAEAISSALRPADFWGRIGGEEFAVFLDLTTAPEAGRIAESIRLAVNRIELAAGDEPVPVSVSVGGACFSNGFAATAAVNEADRRLYRAKHAGRNRVVMDDSTPEERGTAAA